jgi:hypothetical protein
MKFLTGRNWGRPNTARFMLSENSDQRDGIPDFLRTAILLKRHAHDNRFRVFVFVQAEVDTLSNIERMLGRTEQLLGEEKVQGD